MFVFYFPDLIREIKSLLPGVKTHFYCATLIILVSSNISLEIQIYSRRTAEHTVQFTYLKMYLTYKQNPNFTFFFFYNKCLLSG